MVIYAFVCIAKVVYLRAQMELAGPPQHKSQWHLACRQIAIVFIASRPLWMLPSTFMLFFVLNLRSNTLNFVDALYSSVSFQFCRGVTALQSS